MTTGAIVSNCQITGNQAPNYGSGVWIDGAWGPVLLTDCVLIGNTPSRALDMAHGGMVRNCLITGNTSAPAVVAMTGNSGTYGGTHKLQNCTIAGNVGIGFKIYANSTRSNVENCIIYSNTTDIDVTGSDTNKLWHICASFTNFPPDQGNITNNPLFTGAATGNYRVVASSPCVNTGTNENWMTNAVDLDGHRRIDRFNGQVDIGAYEFEPQGSMFRMY